MIPNFKISKYFNFYEFTNTRHTDLQVENMELAVPHLIKMCYFAEFVLDAIREEVGILRVNSGFRSPKLNKFVGGHPSSRHLEGIAADVTQNDWDWPKTQAMGRRAYDKCLINGIGAKIIIEGAEGQFWLHINKDTTLTLWEGVAGVYTKIL